MEELIKKIDDRIRHLQNERIHMKQFVRTAKLAEAQKIYEWVIEFSKLRQDAVIEPLPNPEHCSAKPLCEDRFCLKGERCNYDERQ